MWDGDPSDVLRTGKAGALGKIKDLVQINNNRHPSKSPSSVNYHGYGEDFLTHPAASLTLNNCSFAGIQQYAGRRNMPPTAEQKVSVVPKALEINGGRWNDSSAVLFVPDVGVSPGCWLKFPAIRLYGYSCCSASGLAVAAFALDSDRKPA